MKPLLQIKQVSKVFGEGTNKQEVLKNITFDIYPWEFVSIMGPSGSGKSTLLYLLGGLDHPTAGEILIEGKGINGLNDKE